MAPPRQLSDLPTVPGLYGSGELSPSSSAAAAPNTSFNSKISLIRTDITTLAVTAIVNAANKYLLVGGGVDGAIHRAAGRELYEECLTLDGCDTGSAKITKGYNLPCEYVIHAVGPVYRSSKYESDDSPAKLLASCYTTSLDLLEGIGGGSIAFSALSTGIYGYPSDEAAEVAIGAVRGWLEADEEKAKKVARIVFCSFLEKDERAYLETMPKFFPSTEADGKEDADTGNAAQTEDTTTETENALPSLPDVPSEEPKELGQPDHKKARVDDGTKE